MRNVVIFWEELSSTLRLTCKAEIITVGEGGGGTETYLACGLASFNLEHERWKDFFSLEVVGRHFRPSRLIEVSHQMINWIDINFARIYIFIDVYTAAYSTLRRQFISKSDRDLRKLQGM